jgi:hypothetical protein
VVSCGVPHRLGMEMGCAYMYTHTFKDNNAFLSRDGHDPIRTPQLSVLL